MFCQPFNISPILLPGESWEVFYKLQSSATWLPWLPNPTVNVFDICNLLEGVYDYKIRRVKANGVKCKFRQGVFVINTNGNNYIWQVTYLNNDPIVTVELELNTNTLCNQLYSSNPLIGTNVNLPAITGNVNLIVPGKIITSATCNGNTITPNASIASWAGVNGNVIVEFSTAIGGISSVFIGADTYENEVCTTPDWTGNVYFTGTLGTGTVLYTDNTLTTTLGPVGNYVWDFLSGTLYNYDALTSTLLTPTGNSC